MLLEVQDLILRTLFKILWILPVNSKKVVFSSFRGRQYSDNPKAVSEKLQEIGGVEVVWILNNPQYAPDGVKCVKEKSLGEIFELATSKVWVDNCRKRRWIPKRKTQFYIQLWHGNIAGKKVEGDADLSPEYIKGAKYDSRIADLFISGSKWATNNYREAFWYDGEIAEYGNPRSDIFYTDHEHIIKKVRTFYGINKDTRIALYAPTFRNNKRLDVYNLDYQRLLDRLAKKWGGDWVVLVRLHPNLTDLQDQIPYSSQVMNGLSYQEINDLIVSCDLLITDYSSCMFDAMEAGKKVFLYALDAKEYENERGHYFSLRELPFGYNESTDELLASIDNFDIDKFSDKVDMFKKSCGIINDGHASERVANRIISELSGVRR